MFTFWIKLKHNFAARSNQTRARVDHDETFLNYNFTGTDAAVFFGDKDVQN